jgi:hypothetical protein
MAMTAPSSSLAEDITVYASGLEAEFVLLEQLDQLSVAQQTSSVGNDVAGVARFTDERMRLMNTLVTIEHELKPIRERLAEHRHDAMRLPGFDQLVVRHREAAALVARILTADQQTLDALRAAEDARRFAAQAIEAGETTLAAYRRVVAPPPSNAALVDERG